MTETTEAMALLAAGRQVPFMGLQHVLHHTEKIEKGFVLEPQELIEYGDFYGLSNHPSIVRKRINRLPQDYINMHKG